LPGLKGIVPGARMIALPNALRAVGNARAWEVTTQGASGFSSVDVRALDVLPARLA
jgi:hypothetical protein